MFVLWAIKEFEFELSLSTLMSGVIQTLGCRISLDHDPTTSDLEYSAFFSLPRSETNINSVQLLWDGQFTSIMDFGVYFESLFTLAIRAKCW